jgi:hypothetical protein
VWQGARHLVDSPSETHSTSCTTCCGAWSTTSDGTTAGQAGPSQLAALCRRVSRTTGRLVFGRRHAHRVRLFSRLSFSAGMGCAASKPPSEPIAQQETAKKVRVRLGKVSRTPGACAACRTSDQLERTSLLLQAVAPTPTASPTANSKQPSNVPNTVLGKPLSVSSGGATKLCICCHPFSASLVSTFKQGVMLALLPLHNTTSLPKACSVAPE